MDVERIDLRDGSVLFKFKVDRPPRPVTEAEQRRLAVEVERRLWGDTKTNENIIARWFMTVKYLASTLSFENAVVYVASTPFRLVFWTLAYAIRAVFWILMPLVVSVFGALGFAQLGFGHLNLVSASR